MADEGLILPRDLARALREKSSRGAAPVTPFAQTAVSEEGGIHPA